MQGLRTARKEEFMASGLACAARLRGASNKKPRPLAPARQWFIGLAAARARAGGWPAAGAARDQLKLTSCTSNTTAWFGPIGDCGVLP